MGWLGKILKRKAVENSIKGCGKQLNEIWNIEDTSNFVAELSMYIAEKCQFVDNMQVLSLPERFFYITQSLEMEVNNGGFDQFFLNSSGDFSNELVNAFLEIGAVKTAEICKKAVSIFDGKVPGDRDDRDDVISNNEEFEAILDECDQAFFEYEEDLDALNYAYVMKNRELFS